MTLSDEMTRCEIEDADGNYLGTVVYVRRRHKAGGSSYGWRPEKAHKNSRLMDSTGAILALLGDRRCRICGGIGDDAHDGAIHDARSADMP